MRVLKCGALLLSPLVISVNSRLSSTECVVYVEQFRAGHEGGDGGRVGQADRGGRAW